MHHIEFADLLTYLNITHKRKSGELRAELHGHVCAYVIPWVVGCSCSVGEQDRDLESGGATFEMRITQALLASKATKREVLIEVLTRSSLHIGDQDPVSL